MSRHKKDIGPGSRGPAQARNEASKHGKVTKPPTRGKRSTTLAQSKVKAPSIFQSVMYGTYDERLAIAASAAPKPLSYDPKSVLNRPTARTKHFRKLHSNPSEVPAIEPKESVAKEAITDTPNTDQQPTTKPEAITEEHKAFMNRDDVNIFHRKLPQALRRKIFRLVVVNDKHFTYPSSTTGREQPDLAMTCRAIRQEALKIYHAENVFAIEVQRFRKYARRPVQSTDKWLDMMAVAGWLRQVQHWVFVDEVTVNTASTEDLDVVKKLSMETVIISLDLEKKISHLDQHGVEIITPRLEVHREAKCLLSTESTGTCNVKVCPSWFNDIVINAFLAKTDSQVELRVDKMIGMLQMFAQESGHIVELRCDEV